MLLKKKKRFNHKSFKVDFCMAHKIVHIQTIIKTVNFFFFSSCLDFSGHDAGISKKAIKLRPIGVIKG